MGALSRVKTRGRAAEQVCRASALAGASRSRGLLVLIDPAAARLSATDATGQRDGRGQLANRHDSPLLAPTPDRPEGLGPLPDIITVHLDAHYDSDTTRALLSERGLHGRIAHKGEKAPIQASRRWHVERTHAWQNAFHRLARCYEHRVTGIDAYFDLADTTITVRSPIWRSWTTHRWDERPNRRP